MNERDEASRRRVGAVVAVLGTLLVVGGAAVYKALCASRLQFAAHDAAFYLDVASNVAAGRGLVADIVIDPAHGQPPPHRFALIYYLFPLLVGRLAPLAGGALGAGKLVSIAGSTLTLLLVGRLASAFVEGSRRALDPTETRSLHTSVGPFLGIGLLGFAFVWWPRRDRRSDPVAGLLAVYGLFILAALTFRQEAEPFRWHYDRRYAFVLVPILAYHVHLARDSLGRRARLALLLALLAVVSLDLREARGFLWTRTNFWFQEPPSALALADLARTLPSDRSILSTDAAYLNFKAGRMSVVLYPYPAFPRVGWLVDRYGCGFVALHRSEEPFTEGDAIRERLTAIARVGAGSDPITLYRVGTRPRGSKVPGS